MFISTYEEKINEIKAVLAKMTPAEHARFGAQFESDLTYFEEKEAARQS